ncbi:MAG: hypothetical protein ABI216_19575 [Devosia sp.]
MSSIAVTPSAANHIRAQAAANPRLTPRQLAVMLGVEQRRVELALQKRDTRRVKSIAP